MAMFLEFYKLRFRLSAQGRIVFPAGKAGNVLRGAFGSTLRKQFGDCAYLAIFEPSASGRFANRPRPFVFRADHLDGKVFSKGRAFEFGMNLFDTSPAALERIVDTFTAMKHEGLGAHREKVKLLGVETVKHAVNLAPGSADVSRIQVDFLTPTELKNKNNVVDRPEFPILFARIFERVNSLGYFYGGGTLQREPRCGREVQMTECSLTHCYVERRSSKTGQRHRVGGFTGWAVYQGDLRECLPYLQAAEFTGVGRHTSWGNGRLETNAIEAEANLPGPVGEREMRSLD
jgi:CRISPR-associated endoribonuclease Cas6